jgi:hypothetical protein
MVANVRVGKESNLSNLYFASRRTPLTLKGAGLTYLLSARYAFDVIGELYFGQMFGFMEHRTDHGSYIASLDTLLPVLTLTALAPSYVRPLVLGMAVLSPTVRNALKAVDHIANAARGCVTRRKQALSAGHQDIRRDLLQQLFEIHQQKGEKVDFGEGEITYEAYVAMYVLSVPRSRGLNILD